MQRITLDSEVGYVITEKELKEIRADGQKKFANKIKLHMIKYCHSRLEQQYCAMEVIDYIGKLMGEKDYSMDVETELEKHDAKIRTDERRKFAEWLEENGLLIRMRFCGDSNYDELSAEDVLEEYEKENTDG